jgi:hypothetical protein
MPIAPELACAVCEVDRKYHRVGKQWHFALNDDRSAVVIFKYDFVHWIGR